MLTVNYIYATCMHIIYLLLIIKLSSHLNKAFVHLRQQTIKVLGVVAFLAFLLLDLTSSRRSVHENRVSVVWHIPQTLSQLTFSVSYRISAFALRRLPRPPLSRLKVKIDTNQRWTQWSSLSLQHK